ERDRAGAFRECLNHPPRVFDFLRRRRERGVDRIDLVRMNRDLAGKTGSASSLRLASQAGRIAEVDVSGVDRLDLRRDRGEQAQRSRETVSEIQVALFVTISAGSQSRRQ